MRAAVSCWQIKCVFSPAKHLSFSELRFFFSFFSRSCKAEVSVLQLWYFLFFSFFYLIWVYCVILRILLLLFWCCVEWFYKIYQIFFYLTNNYPAPLNFRLGGLAHSMTPGCSTTAARHSVGIWVKWRPKWRQLWECDFQGTLTVPGIPPNYDSESRIFELF